MKINGEFIKRCGWGRAAVWLVPALLTMTLSASAAYVIRADGRRVEGTDIRIKPDGEVVLTTAQGQYNFPLGQYRQAAADKPAEYDKAAQLFNGQKYDEAIPLLDGIASRLRGLSWDGPAGALLMQCQVAKGDGAAAVAAYNRLVAGNAKLAEDADVQDAYRHALITAKQFNRLAPMLDAAIAGAVRRDAARAQLLRGDMHMAQNSLEEAVMDYLRTALLFNDVKDDGELQAEALWKAGETLQKMKDERSAQFCFQELRQLYPNSRAAGKIGKK